MNMKKMLAVGGTMAALTAMAVTPLSATGWTKAEGTQGDTQAFLTVNDEALTKLDVSVTEKVNFTAAAGGVLTQTNDYQFKNNAKTGTVECTQVTAVRGGKWTVNADTEAILALPLDSKIVGFSYDSHDMSVGAPVEGKEAGPGVTTTLTKVSGRMAPQSKAISEAEQVATFQATLGLKKA